MKHKLALVFFMMLYSLATLNAQVLSNKVTLKIDTQPVSELVKQLELQTPYHFYYDETVFSAHKFSVDVKNVTLDSALHKAFTGSEFHFAIYKDAIFLTKSARIVTVLDSMSHNKLRTSGAENNTKLAADLLANPVQAPTDPERQLELIGTNAKNGKSKFTLTGTVVNEESREPLQGVTVAVIKLNTGDVTDVSGNFSIQLPIGEHELNVSAVGVTTKRKIVVKGDGKTTIYLKISPLALKEVTITGNKATMLTGTQMGVDRLDIKTIKQVPTVFGEADILRVVLTLPGVKSVGESSAGFNVRGGSTDQNLILFDESTIYNPTHFFGFFSAFSADVVSDVELFKGSIPAKYGGRLSSVLKLNSRQGDPKEFRGTAGIGLLTSRINFEGPIIKDRTSFIIGGRTTYANWITSLLPKNSAYSDAKVSFYDVNLNINHIQNEKNTFDVSAYLSRDQSNLGTDTTFQYQNRNLSLRWKHTFNEKLFGSLTVGRDEYSYDNFSNYQPEIDYRLKFSIGQSNFRTNFKYAPRNTINIEFGTSSIYYSNKPGSLTPYNEQSLVISDILPKEQGMEHAVFIEPQYEITPGLTVNAGLRYSVYTNLGPTLQNEYAEGLPKSDVNIVSANSYGAGKGVKTYQGPEYRLGATIMLNPSLSVKAGYNTQRQYIHMLSNTTSVSPTDVWKLSDLNIAPQRGQQFSLGIYKNFNSNIIETSVEGYYKKITDFLDYKSGAQLILNHKLEQDVLPTSGKAYGVEFLVKKTAGQLNGWVSYTYSRTLLKSEATEGSSSINQGKFYPANYDKPHDVTLVGNYRLSQRVSFSVNVTYSTGRPITLPVGKYFYNGGQRLLYAERNQYRIPDYFRSDISLNILGNHKVKQLTHNSWTIGVYNVTNRKNAFATFFVSQNKVVNGYQLSIFGSAIPFINYNIRFK